MHKFAINNTVLLSGWLFADLLLGLMVIFLVSIPGIPPLQIPTPKLKVSPGTLTSTSHECKSSRNGTIYSCTITLEETVDSINTMTWQAQNTVSPNVTFSPTKGTLSPGAPVKVTISAIPCQNGSFTFTGSRNAIPVSIFWSCTLAPVKLDFSYKEYIWTVSDPNALMNGDKNQFNQLQQQATHSIEPVHRRVGLVIVYAGAGLINPNTNEASVLSNKVADDLLKTNIPALHDARTYSNLHDLSLDTTKIRVDVFYFTR